MLKVYESTIDPQIFVVVVVSEISKRTMYHVTRVMRKLY